MEMANPDTAVPPPVRTATKADAPHVTQLIQEANYYHVHLDWRLPVDWLGSPGFVVAPSLSSSKRTFTETLFGERTKLQACLAATADPAPAAWVRVACLRDVADPEEMLGRMLAPVTAFLRETAVTHLGWLAIESWPNSWLPRLGFQHHCHIETYIKNDLSFPDVPVNEALTIRPMQPGDVSALAAIEAAAFEPLWRHSAEALRAIRHTTFSFDVALHEGTPVGFQFSTQADQHAHLARMAVAPQAQHQGVGSALLIHAFHTYRRHHFNYISLNTQEDNVASQRLYQRFGFRPSGQRYPVWVKRLDQTVG